MSSEDRVTCKVAAELLTVQEVAALCRVSTDSVYRAIQRGELEAEEIFGCLRIRRGALKEYRRERRRVIKRRVTQLRPRAGARARGQREPARADARREEAGGMRTWVFERGDTGSWCCRWREGGRNRSRSFGPGKKGRELAEDFASEIERRLRLDGTTGLDRGSRTLAEFIETWYDGHAPNLARSTLAAYAVAWERYILPALGPVKLRQIRPRMVEEFKRELRRRGVGDPMIVKTLTVLQSVLSYAVVCDEIDANPVRDVRKPSRKPTRVVRPLTPDQVEASVSACGRETRRSCRSWRMPGRGRQKRSSSCGRTCASERS